MKLEDLRKVLESEENIRNLKEFREKVDPNKWYYYNHALPEAEYLTVLEFEIDHIKYKIHRENDNTRKYRLISNNLIFYFCDLYVFSTKSGKKLIFEDVTRYDDTSEVVIFLEEKK